MVVINKLQCDMCGLSSEKHTDFWVVVLEYPDEDDDRGVVAGRWHMCMKCLPMPLKSKGFTEKVRALFKGKS